MKAITLSELRRRTGSGSNISETLRSRCRAATITIPPDDASKATAARACAEKFGARSGILLIDEWGVFPSSEKTADIASWCDRFDLPPGPPHFRALAFDMNEFPDAVEFYVLAARSVWDIYLTTSSGKRVVFISHDEFAMASFGLPDFRDCCS